jgi:hypothetical protein
MTTRNRRYWQTFVQRSLHLDALQDVVSGVCFVNNKDSVEYVHGCFRSIASGQGNRDVEMMMGTHCVPVDPTCFRTAFDQLTRQVIVEERQGLDSKDHQKAVAPSSLCIGDISFHIVSMAFTSICTVASGKAGGLVIERVPFGIFVIAFEAPHTVERVFAAIDPCCAALR